MRSTWSRLGCVLFVSALACTDDSPGAGQSTETGESGDGEPSDGDGEPGDGDGEPGDGDGEPGDGDADAGDEIGDGDGDGDGDEPTGCNGHEELCDRPYDEVVFPGTHNSHSATGEGFSQFIANQAFGVGTQLEDGVRVLMLDTYYDEAKPSAIVLCHGPCELGSTPHLEVLTTIVEFLETHPKEVVTLIYEDYVAPADLAVDYGAAGAVEFVYIHETNQPWPTLGEMVAANTRLVVTAEHSGPPPAWHQYVWDLAWDTPYGPQDPAALSCELNRGSPDNDLFLVNHWVNNDLGLPSLEAAEQVNAYDFLLARAQECQALWGHPVNFLAVDFYDRGDLFAVVDTLNGF